MGKRKIYFDVINSVKGGSGKSTVSLLLATCLQHDGAKVYVIDLDLHGSSWHTNFFKESWRTADIAWVNDWMEDAEYIKKTNPFVSIDVSVKITEHDTKEYHIPLAIVNTDKPIVVDEIETDLFERAIFQIINRIISEESSEGDTVAVHIVMDMPPSNEVHAERVLNHLLMDTESPLVQAFNDAENSYKDFDPYVVQLIMLSSVSGAHLKLNEHYIDRFAKARTFSSLLDEFIRNDRFHLQFWGNDAVGGIQKEFGDPTIREMTNGFIKMLQKVQGDFAEKMAFKMNDDALSAVIAPFSPIVIPHSDEIQYDIIGITKAVPDLGPIPAESLTGLKTAISAWKEHDKNDKTTS